MEPDSSASSSGTGTPAAEPGNSSPGTTTLSGTAGGTASGGPLGAGGSSRPPAERTAPPAPAPATRTRRRTIPKDEAGNTPWLIFQAAVPEAEPTDLAANEEEPEPTPAAEPDLKKWDLIGQVSARGREHAERLWMGDHPLTEGASVTISAVSIAAWQPHKKGLTSIPRVINEEVPPPSFT